MKYITSIDKLRAKKPLIHHITNYVTVNDCANITLAIGASPIMADAIEEAAEIAGISSALVLNMGTLNEYTVKSMIAAGKAANAADRPIIFDPVGAGASRFRNEAAEQLLKEVQVSVLRGNASEIGFIAGLQAETKGVDASEQDLANVEGTYACAAELARSQNCIVAVTGPHDVIADGDRMVVVKNGHPHLSRLTGTGCMCSSLIGSCCGAEPASIFESAVTALLCMGIAGEIAYENSKDQGNGSFHRSLHNAVSNLTDEILLRRCHIDEA